MSPYLNPVRESASNGAKIGKYLKKIHLPKFCETKFRRFKESLKHPFSFMGIISVVLFIVFFTIPFLRSFSGVSEGSFYLSEESFSFLAASSGVFPETSSQNHFLSSANEYLAGSPNFLLIGKNSIRAATPPVMVSTQVLGAISMGYDIEDEKKAVSEYIVENGDTLSSLAAQFDISLDTILWANDLTGKSAIKIGQKLVIPPVSGVIHYVKSGDTVSEIARTYKGKTSEIVAFNELSDENDIYVGDILIVPNGVMPSLPTKSLTTQTPTQTPISSVYFIAPIKGTVSQGLHWHNAVDISNSCGSLVFAAAQGVVQRVSYGWNGGYGSYITILHPNGVVTLYAHLSEISVSSGASVSQGTIIGRVGNTGRTAGATGCHVHFEVRGAQNPFAGYRVGSRF